MSGCCHHVLCLSQYVVSLKRMCDVGAVERPREGVEDSECFANICVKGAEGARKLVSGGRVRADLRKTASLSSCHSSV